MSILNKPVQRRGFLRGALATAVVVPLGGALASCAGGGGSSSTSGAAGGEVSATNPFGVAKTGALDAVIFKGGYGIDYVDFAGAILKKNFPDVTVKISPSTDIAQEMQPRFVGGTPPDLIDNSGAKSIGFSTILDQLEDLKSITEANNLEGTKIADTLYDGVLAPGTFDGKVAAINYVLTVYAVWYSKSLFDANGWTVPTTWDEAIALGAKAKAKGKYLFLWGKEAATYYQTMAIESAIKEGGDQVRLDLENLKPNCWSAPAMQSVFTALEKIIKAGYMKPGGSGTQFTAAQAQWSNNQDALLYPSGSWIENEMKDQTKADFKMTGAPTPVVSTSPKIPQSGVRSAAGEPFIVPTKGKNVAAGKELLRTMLSKDSAVNFAKTKLAPTVVKGTVPADGFGSTALVSQTTMLDNAKKNIFTWNFVDLYGMNPDQLVPWNSFLDGKLDAAGLTKALQEITDKVANDSSVKKIEVK
ncbi:carbohydrate ABC transporter, N-acetylglucosamine/diacetylchitobiose-binding protein [Bacillus sp. SRB_336]|nr:carbohydrate ABC transporter, N-acetylglucosamine/diacetylchitobiose-binding protein [Bacillus sp. SRB_336]